MQDYTGAIVRGQYDKSSIIDAYDGTTGEESYDILQIVDTTGVGEPIAVDPVALPEPVVDTQPAQQQTVPVIDKKRTLYISHTVSRGETLGTIAQKYGIPTNTLKEMNGIKGTFLSIHQKLVIPRINGVQYTVQK
jgi:LysM repeat protein